MEDIMSNNTESGSIAINIAGVKKMYKLGQIGGGTLQKDLQSWWARKRGMEDPNSIIGERERSSGDTFMALNGVDLTIYQGEAVGIIGSNGAGKSTLLKLLSRVTAPTEGEIDIYGRIASMLEVGTGFNGELTGRENVYMNGAILGMTKSEIDEKMERIIDFSEVREFIDTPVKRYSSGMFVKLAFSVAAHLDAEIMIMDEVLAVGDVAFQTKCLDKMREAAKVDGRTVLYVSHNMNTIRKLCDRCIVLDKGKVVFNGEVEEAIERYINVNDEMQLVNEYGFDRERTDIDRMIKIRKTTFINKDEYPIYRDDENIELTIDFESNMEIRNLAFRWTIHSIDDDRVGMATTGDSITTMKGNNTVSISVFLDWLAPGKYFVDLTAYSVDQYGNNQLHDVVNKAFTFERVVHISKNNKMNWNHSWWGYLMFPEIRHF